MPKTWDGIKSIININKEEKKDINCLNTLMPGGNRKFTHTETNLQLSAAGLFKYVRPFCYHQALKGKSR